MTPSTPSGSWVQAIGARRNLGVFLAGKLVATLADQMLAVAIGFQVYALTGSALDLGLIGLVQFVPSFVLSLPSGHTADRFDRRAITFACHGALAGASLLLVSSSFGSRLYAVLFFMATARTFLAPAEQALLSEIVEERELPRAVAWSSSLNELASIAGPAMGGFLYAARQASAVYLTTAVAYAFAALTSLAVSRRAAVSTSTASLGTALSGLKYVIRSQALFGAISLDLFAVLLGSATALLPVYARDVLHVGPSGLGILRSAPAIGAAAMALTLSLRPLRGRTGLMLLGSVAVYGAATALFGLSRTLWLSVAALALVGAADMVSVVVRSTLLQLATPNAMRGRVNAVAFLFIGASSELGALESGLAAEWLGPVAAVVAGGLLACLIVAVYSAVFPRLRRLGAHEDNVAPDRLHSGSNESA